MKDSKFYQKKEVEMNLTKFFTGRQKDISPLNSIKLMGFGTKNISEGTCLNERLKILSKKRG